MTAPCRAAKRIRPEITSLAVRAPLTVVVLFRMTSDGRAQPGWDEVAAGRLRGGEAAAPTGGAGPAALDQLLVAPVGIVISSVASSMIGLTGQTWLDTL